MSSHFLRFPPVPGFVYIFAITNDGNVEVKVGGTTREPETRLSEIVYQHDFFERPVIYGRWYVVNVWQVEHMAHRILEEHSIKSQPEYFRCSPERAGRAVESAIHMYSLLVT